MHFVVCVFKTIIKDNRFLMLIEEGGRFAKDLIASLGKRITGDTR